ncbi:unnamed protein product [Symbiodinium sp. CCMP2592]|nr:unnamed protein product [Symbiodinium sp. CCMP2592]
MDDEDTESYRSADVATLPDSQASPDSDSMDDTSDFTQLYDSRPVSPEYSGTAETAGIALVQRSAAQRGPTWRRPLSAAITQQSFVDFLRITEVPLWAVVDFGTHHYFQQYTSSGADRTSELTQLLSEIRGYDMSATIEFFLLFLEGDHLETFYEDLCLQIYWSLRGGSKGQGLLESFLYTTTGSHIDSTYDPEARPTRAADTVQAIIDVLDSPVSSPNVHGGTISQVSMDGHTELSSPLADCASSAPGDTADDLSSEIETQSLIQGVALRSDITQYLQRQPSETLDDGQLALYLQFRGISFDVVMDWGTFFYLRQYEYDDEAQSREITQHLHDELASENIHEALCFFRYMLEGQDKEQFYVEIYKQVIYRIRSHPRPPFFADALRADAAREPLVYRLSGTWAASLVMAEKRTFDAAFEGHLAHVVHQNSTSNSKQPWERSIVNVPSVLPKAFLGRGRLGNVLTHTAAAPVKAPSGPSAINLTATGGKLPRKVGPSWIQRQSDNRHAAVMKWLRIAKEGGDFFGVCARVAEDAEAGLPASLQESLGDVFSLKASSTLHSRAGPVLRYMAFCWRIREQPFPLSEQKMYRFVKEYCSGAAPTFASSFMSSIGFMQYVLEAKVPADCVSSRLAGAVSKLYLEKRKLQQKPPLTASQIRALERIVLGLIPEVRADVDKYAAGCFLYCVFARARYSDMQCSGELAKDIVQGERGPRGYLEARVTRSKTSHNLERKTRYLAMVSPIWGLEQDSWALAWLEVAGRAGPAWGPDMPLLPSPTDGGQWQKAPMSAQAGARWLRHLLYRAGEDVASVKAVGTHSCKATLLSWMSKWGASKEIRSILGYHSSANAGTDVIYARDSVSPALRELEEMVSAVAYRRFFPDATRSGMFAESLAARGDAHDKAEVGSDSSSDRSDDEEEPDTLEEEKVVEDSVGDFEPSGCLRESLEGKAVFRHVTTRFIHLVASEEGTTFKCGRQITSSYLECSAIPRFLHPICRQCFPEAR